MAVAYLQELVVPKGQAYRIDDLEDLSELPGIVASVIPDGAYNVTLYEDTEASVSLPLVRISKVLMVLDEGSAMFFDDKGPFVV